VEFIIIVQETKKGKNAQKEDLLLNIMLQVSMIVYHAYQVTIVRMILLME